MDQKIKFAGDFNQLEIDNSFSRSKFLGSEFDGNIDEIIPSGLDGTKER